jgi:hypothetical protein
MRRRFVTLDVFTPGASPASARGRLGRGGPEILPHKTAGKCRIWVMSAVFATSAIGPVYHRLRKDRGSAANRR